MTNEEIRNELNEATRDFRETTRKVNEALNHAAGRLNKCEQEAYDRGLNDCWELTKKIQELKFSERREIFPAISDVRCSTIMDDFTPQQALEKIRAWEEKKKEEAEKIQVGDVVEYNTSFGLRKGIVLSIEPKGAVNMYKVLDKAYNRIGLMGFEVKKTGKHVDILGVLNKEN